MRRKGGFTLVEIFVVMAVIGMLAGILLPALSGAREMARRASCISNLHQAGLALFLYGLDNSEFLPAMQSHQDPRWLSSYGTNNSAHDWSVFPPCDWFTLLLPNYIPDGLVFYCPSTGHDGFYGSDFYSFMGIQAPDMSTGKKSIDHNTWYACDYSYYGDNDWFALQTKERRKIMTIGNLPTLRIASDALQAELDATWQNAAAGANNLSMWHAAHPNVIYNQWKYMNVALGCVRGMGSGACHMNHRCKEERGRGWRRWCAVNNCLFLDGRVEPLTPGQIKYISGFALDYQTSQYWWFY